MRVHNLYVDDKGESHWRDVEVEYVETTRAGRLSKRLPATGIIFREVQPDYDLDWHPAPRRQYIINLDAGVELTASDGEARKIGAGEVILVEDVWGKGHLSKALDRKIRNCIFVTLDEPPATSAAPKSAARRRVSSPHVPEPPPGTFSRAIGVGSQLFVAGITANSPAGIEGADMYQQTRAVFTKIRHLVEAAGGTMNDIVRLTGFVTDISKRDDYLRARRAFFTGDPPASTLVEIKALVVPELLVEVEATAIIGSSAA